MSFPRLANDPFRDAPTVLKGHSSGVQTVAFSPSDRILASGSWDKTIQLWNVASGANIATLTGHSRPLYSVAFSPDNTMIASGSSGETIKLWDVESRAEIVTLKGHSDSVKSVAFSLDGTLVISGSLDKTVRIWDVKLRRSVRVLKGHSDDVYSVAISPYGKIIASGSYDNNIRLWDVATGTTISKLKGHTSEVRAVTFSPNGENLASGSHDKTIRLWEVATGTNLAKIKGHSAAVRSLAFSPNGKYLVSGSYDKTIRLLDVASRNHISTLKAHSKEVNSVAFSSDGTRLVSGSEDKTVQISKVSLAEEGGDSIEPAQEVSVPPNNDITGSVTRQGSTPIAYGAWGDLFSGVHKDHGKVALKRSWKVLDEVSIRCFLKEVDLWCTISHPNILPYLGMCRIGPDVYIASRFIENGDLLSYLAKGKALNRGKLVLQVAKGLHHLHEKCIIHGDVKAQNILIADDGSALLSDFGLVNAFNSPETSTDYKGAGSVRWMAPELFQNGVISMTSDVYSFGITISEVLSGHAPYPKISSNLAVIRFVNEHGGRPEKEPLSGLRGESYVKLWATAEHCWNKDAKARPSMAQALMAMNQSSLSQTSRPL